MRPIINPLWFYLIGISENVACTFWVVGGLLLAIGVIIGIVLMIEAWDMKEDVVKTLLKVVKKSVIIGGILVTIGNLTPSKDTCYKMMTAALVTPNNITAVGEAATDVVDYIVDSVDQLLEGDKAAEEYEEDKESD
jgi:hypothetical protein